MKTKVKNKKEEGEKRMYKSCQKARKTREPNAKGITLIALVVTIVVLLILAGVSINAVFSDEGIIKQAQKVQEKWNNAEQNDLEGINYLNDILNSYVDGTGSGATEGTETVNVTGITLSETSASIEVGKTKTLTATVEPNTASNKNITWSSSAESVATVSSAGVVTAVSVGNATITATAADGSGVTATCAITVKTNWELLSKIAKEISNNDDTVTKSTSETTVSVEGKSYTISVGDTFTLTDTSNNNYTVRVLGFNHDKLANTAAYEGNNTYAGISFEFVTFLNTAGINSSSTNTGGWGACELRSTLNGTTKATLENASYIKQVNKRYIATYNSASSVTTSNDYLWLLACSEIWNNGHTNQNCPYGYAMANESTMYESGDTQTQYKYYASKLGSTAIKSATDITKKPNTSSSAGWWLRFPYYSSSGTFCYVRSIGGCSGNFASLSLGVAPGFSI